MTSPDPVEGGLAEPAGLEPEQGTLALVLPGPPATRADWEKAAAGVLRKAGRLSDDDPDDAVWAELTRTTLDGVAISPLGTPALTDEVGGQRPPHRAGGRDVRVELGGADAEQLNAEALADLEGGATSLWLHAGPTTDSRPSSTACCSTWRRWSSTPTATRSPLRGGSSTTSATPARPPAPTWASPPTPDDDLVAVARLALDAGVRRRRRRRVRGPRPGRLRRPGARLVDGRGGPRAAGPRRRRASGRARPPACVEFRYAATDEQFPTIAKLRAAPRAVGAAARALRGVADPSSSAQHAVTSRPMMSAYDPWVNMLRTTVAAFAAGVGGADAVTVRPFDGPSGVPTPRPPDRPQQIGAAGRRVPRRHGRPTRRAAPTRWSGSPTTWPWRRWELLGRSRAARPLDDAGRRDRRRARPPGRHPRAAGDRPHRVPPPRRDAARARRPSPTTSPLRRGVRGAARRARRRARLPGHAGAGRRAHRPGDVRHQPARRRRHRGRRRRRDRGVDDVLAAYAGQPVVCLAGTDAAYAEWGADRDRRAARRRAPGT